MEMTAASRKRRMPASLVARAVLRAKYGTNCRSTTSADKSSMRLSAPKAKSTGLRARHAEKRARAHSTTIQISVTTCNRIIWREISPEVPAHPHPWVNVPRAVSSSKLIAGLLTSLGASLRALVLSSPKGAPYHSPGQRPGFQGSGYTPSPAGAR
jgi:hypothetical protein